MTKIGVIGGGKIGEALIGGLVSGKTQASDVHVVDPSAGRLDQLKEKYGITPQAKGVDAVKDADLVFFCVKPYDTLPAVENVADTLAANSTPTVVASMAAGITIDSLQGVVPEGTPVIRVMPNTPMLVGKGTVALARGTAVTDEQMNTTIELLSTVGWTGEVKESQMDAVTAISGSAPAYFFLMVESMIDAGVQLGLTRELATELASSTALGAATMMAEGDDDPVTLRANVSSPGGSTVAAIRSFEESGLRGAVYRAMDACATRSNELG